MDNILEKLSKKKFEFEWSDVFSTTKVNVTLPDLIHSKYKMTADWGTCISIDLEPCETISLCYNGEDHNLEQKKLKIESPILKKERDQYPIYLKLEDDIKGINYKVYFNHKLDVGKVDIERLRSDEIVLNDQQNAENMAQV